MTAKNYKAVPSCSDKFTFLPFEVGRSFRVSGRVQAYLIHAEREFSMGVLLIRDQLFVRDNARLLSVKTLCLLSLLLISLMTKEATAMSLGEKLYLMSEISGTITFNGEPAAGAQLKRTVRKAFSRSEMTDETTADAHGYFSLPAVVQTKWIPGLIPAEFVVPSLITVTYQGTEVVVWSSTKRSPEPDTENKGRPLVVECELTGRPRGFWVDGAPFTTRCHWDVDVDPPYDFGPPGSGN